MPQDALHALIPRLATSVACDILRKHAPERLLMQGVRAMWPAPGLAAGPARTLRYLPQRCDGKTAPGGNARTKLLDSLNPGEMVVIDTMRGHGPVVGDLTGLRTLRAGAAGVVTDGPVRDIPEVAQTGLPIFAAGVMPAIPEAPELAWEHDTPIQCGGVLVLPGDWILADAEGVLVVPKSLLGALVAGADALMSEEAFSRALIDRGHNLADSFPIPARLRPAYERWRKSGILPDEAEVRGA